MANDRKTTIDIKKKTEDYQSIFEQLDQKFEDLEAKRSGFPSRYLDDVPFEDFTLEASNLKHEAIRLNKQVLTLQSAIAIEAEYLTSHILLSSAADTLKDFGFEKVTDSLRSAAVASNKDLNEFLKLVGKVKALFESVKILPKAFETDETNQRVFSGYKHRLGGF